MAKKIKISIVLLAALVVALVLGCLFFTEQLLGLAAPSATGVEADLSKTAQFQVFDGDDYPVRLDYASHGEGLDDFLQYWAQGGKYTGTLDLRNRDVGLNSVTLYDERGAVFAVICTSQGRLCVPTSVEGIYYCYEYAAGAEAEQTLWAYVDGLTLELTQQGDDTVYISKE